MSMVSRPAQWSGLRRLYVLCAVICVGLVTIIARLWYLQVAHGPELWEASMGNQLRLIRRVAPRGIIEDRNGKPLAVNRYQVVVSVVPHEIAKNPDVIPRLAQLLGMKPDELSDSISESKTSEFDPVRVKVGVDMATTTRLEELRMSLPGVIVGPEPVRFYPDGTLCGHIMGQMGQIPPEELKARKSEGYQPGDFCGRLGIERAYDPNLHGTDGGQEIQVDARGRMRKKLGDTPSIPGCTVTLAIDKQMQKIAYDALAGFAKQGKPGAAVALDPQTGAVLTLASVPAYDPNSFVQGVSAKDWKSISSNPLKPLINRAVTGGVAPGSTFKLITSAATLETHTASPSDRVYCSGMIMLGRWAKHCHKASGHGSLDMVGALQQSCDVYFYRMGQKMGPDTIAEYARKFGLGKRTGIDLQRDGDKMIETSGLVPDPQWKQTQRHERWMGGETVDYAIGQAMLKCTPLQMCNVAAAIANGGTLYRPQLVDKITRYDALNRPTVVHRLTPEVNGKLGISRGTLDVIVKGMRAVMEPGGTGASGAIAGLSMAGKSGTAQMREHGQMINNAWFVAYAPVEHPRLAICVFVQGGGHGGAVCAPIARKMFAHYFNVKSAGGGGGGNATD